MLTTLIAFVVALGVLITIHEYGHYRVAVACGVKVLKFSVGFGKPLYSWRFHKDGTEFSVGMLPLGGYVKMLDEREAAVEPQERHLAFNNKPLKVQAAVVAAGPVANLLLAVVLYSVVNWGGVEEPQALLATPVPRSLADQAGLRAGDLVRQIAFEDKDFEDVRSFEDFRWWLTQGALTGRDVRLLVSSGIYAGAALSSNTSTRQVRLSLSTVDASELDAQLFKKIGILEPWTQPLIGQVMAGGPADQAGLQAGDRVLRVNQQTVIDGRQLRDLIRMPDPSPTLSVPPQIWEVQRASQRLTLQVQPRWQQESGLKVAKIEAYIGSGPQMTRVKYGLWGGFYQGVVKTAEVSWLTVKMMGKMLIGQASVKNLSGPLTIADYAGKSANLGWSAYLLFLALISVSLGVLNLMPIPVLDGGHLMYYLWHAVTGRAVPDVWMNRLQRGGMVVLLSMMSIALLNDVTRLVG